MNTRQHYEEHLAPYYTWSKGSREVEYANNEYVFKKAHVQPRSPGQSIAWVLGSGAGFQAIPLAQMGYKVTALDFCGSLIKEMMEHGKGLPISPYYSDIMDLNRYPNERPELVVCLGDTLTHLEKAQDVVDLVEHVSEHMLPGGKFIVSFRDYAFERKGADRFILVRQDEKTIFTCFMEYEEFRVRVFDVIYTLTEAGWEQKISNYRKIRLAAEFVRKTLGQHGFEVPNSTVLVNEWATIVAERKG